MNLETDKNLRFDYYLWFRTPGNSEFQLKIMK